MTTYSLNIDGQSYSVEILEIAGDMAQVQVNGTPYEVQIAREDAVSPPVPPVSVPAAAVPLKAAPSGPGAVVAPIPGLILDLRVKVGDSVAAGQVVAVMEAMKMENNLTSPTSGKVREIRVQKGAEVSTGDVIMLIGG
jgi:biotin carboxyl carrier protein